MIRFAGGRAVDFPVFKLYAGRTVFLIGGSPTLLSQNYRRFESRGIVSVGMNNVPSVVRTTMAVFGDTPGCYDRRLLADPSIMKFAREAFSGESLQDGTLWRDAPNTVFFNHQALSEGEGEAYFTDGSPEVIHSRLNVLEMSLALIQLMGASRIVLAGCSFDTGYSYGAELTSDQAERNALLYSQQVGTLKAMKPYLEGRGVTLVDCSLGSKLQGVYETADLDSEIDKALSSLPGSSGRADLRYCTDSGPERGPHPGIRAADAPGRLHIMMAMGVYNPRNLNFYDYQRLGQALMSFLSIARTTPKSVIHFLYTGVGQDFMSCASRVVSSCGDALFDPVFVSEAAARDILGGAVHSGLGPHAALRLAFADMFPNIGECVWLDCDVMVREDLHGFADEAKRALAGNRLYFAGCEYRSRPLVNSGVLFEDLDRLRSIPGEAGRLIGMCGAVDDADGSGMTRKFMDQDIINIAGAARVGRRWNVLLHEYNGDLRELASEDVACLHLTGKYNWMLSPLSSLPGLGFLEDLALSVTGLCPQLDARYAMAGVPGTGGEPSRDHVEGRAAVPVHRDPLKVSDNKVESVDIAFAVSGREFAEVVLPPAMLSYAMNCSVPVNFHVAYSPDTVGDSHGAIVKCGDALGREFGSGLECVPFPEKLVECMELSGDRGSSELRWADHLASAFLHDIFPDVGACIKSDADVICVGDASELVKWCLDRGLGPGGFDAFAVKSFWRSFMVHQYNFGVMPASFDGLRGSGFSEFLYMKMLHGSLVRFDEMMSVAADAGIVSVGEMPPEWNMIQALRRMFVEADRYQGQVQAFDVFYRRKYKVDHDAMLDGSDYRRTTKVYHYTVTKPWDKSNPGYDADIWNDYSEMIGRMMK